MDCADGSQVHVFDDKPWNGCLDRGSYRFNCPLTYKPCEQMREDGKEFICDPTCEDFGGLRKTCTHFI